MTPVLGAERTEEVIRRVNALEKLNEVRELWPFLAVRKADAVRPPFVEHAEVSWSAP
jgi:hypothetical protein